MESTTTVSEPHTVLASSSNHDSSRWTINGRPKIIEFYGFEGEDFRHFLHLLESFFALNGITQDARKVAILRAQLRRVAVVYFENALKERNLTLGKISFAEATLILQDHFVSESIIECYQSAFEEMYQSSKESPSEFLSRLYEAAELANIHDEKFIFARYRAGLRQDIKTFCKEMSAINFQDWTKHSNAWWNAHSVRAIHLVDNPFSDNSVHGNFNGDKGKNLSLTKVNNEKALASKNVFINTTPTSAAEAYADSMSPSIANITARMEALELHSLIPSTDKEGNVDTNIIRSMAVKSLTTDKEFRSFIKNIIQEACDEKVMTRKPYKNYRKNYDGYRNDNYNGNTEEERHYQGYDHYNNYNQPRYYNNHNNFRNHQSHTEANSQLNNYEDGGYQSYRNQNHQGNQRKDGQSRYGGNPNHYSNNNSNGNSNGDYPMFNGSKEYKGPIRNRGYNQRDVNGHNYHGSHPNYNDPNALANARKNIVAHPKN